MIAYPPQKPPTIREQFEAFKAHMATIAPPEIREPTSCPDCGRELGSFIGRRTGRNIVLHFECGGRCRRQFVSGYGDTPAEALRAFEENSWERNGNQTIDLPTFQGMAFSAEGLSTEQVNSLLTMKEEA